MQTNKSKRGTSGTAGNRKKKAKEGTLLHELRGGSVVSLQDLCVSYLCKHIDAVEALGGQPVPPCSVVVNIAHDVVLISASSAIVVDFERD
jgi:hypothetical protein